MGVRVGDYNSSFRAGEMDNLVARCLRHLTRRQTIAVQNAQPSQWITTGNGVLSGKRRLKGKTSSADTNEAILRKRTDGPDAPGSPGIDKRTSRPNKRTKTIETRHPNGTRGSSDGSESTGALPASSGDGTDSIFSSSFIP